MSDAAHLLVPFASCGDEGCAQARQTLALPHLEKLLARLTPQPLEPGEATSLSMPHERVLARESGLPDEDGRIPFAAWQVRQSGADPGSEPWAWITPCHWRVHQDHITMGHPRDLALGADESRALFEAIRPYFEQDGIALVYDAPTLWLARGALFGLFPTASLDRAVRSAIDGWLPRFPEARPLRRLQQEMQMLLYTHPVNEERTRGGQLPVNSFWASGAGVLPPQAAPAPPAGLAIIHSLRDAALLHDWRMWAADWQQFDARECAQLLRDLDAGRHVRITLCGDRHAQTWSGSGPGWMRRLAGAFHGRRAPLALERL